MQRFVTARVQQADERKEFVTKLVPPPQLQFPSVGGGTIGHRGKNETCRRLASFAYVLNLHGIYFPVIPVVRYSHRPIRQSRFSKRYVFGWRSFHRIVIDRFVHAMDNVVLKVPWWRLIAVRIWPRIDGFPHRVSTVLIGHTVGRTALGRRRPRWSVSPSDVTGSLGGCLFFAAWRFWRNSSVGCVGLFSPSLAERPGSSIDSSSSENSCSSPSQDAGVTPRHGFNLST